MALRGAVGFLTRLPLGRSRQAWEALAGAPASMVPVAYLIGLVASVPVLSLPGPSSALAYPLVLVALTGIAHLDGLADLADAAVVHGAPDRRREVMADTVTGVGGTTAIALTVLGLGVAGLALSGAPAEVVVGVIIAAEVSAKLSMVGLAVLGHPAHEGMGSTLTGAGPVQFLLAAGVSVPAVVWLWPSLVPAVGVVGGLGASALVAAWAHVTLGGMSGDVFGATNEVARLAALHVGVLAWTLS